MWNLGTIQPEGEKSVSLEVKTTAVGKAENVVRANAICADEAVARAVTDVRGVAALLLEVVDQEDPIEAGNNEIYTITVTNQGFAPATNVKIVAKLDPDQSYVRSGGATTATHAERTVTFEPLGRLAPKDRATWTVTIKAENEDEVDARFRIDLTADQLTSPVQESESTHMY